LADTFKAVCKKIQVEKHNNYSNVGIGEKGTE